MSRFVAALLISGLFAVPGLAVPFDVQVNPLQSSLTFELCVGGTCDDDSSAVAGTVTVELDSVDFPAQITLYDFDLDLTETLSVHLSWSIFGALDATATGVGILYAYPGTPLGPVPVAGSAFLFLAVPTNAEGMLTYSATGIPCGLLQAAGWPCSDTRNLADEGTQSGDLEGTVTSLDRTVTLVTVVDVTSPLDEAFPDLGTVHVYGTIRGTAYVPQPPGDVDGDGDVDLVDYGWLAGCMAGPEVSTPPVGCSQYHFDNSDLDDDGDVDLGDFSAFARDFPA